MERNIIHADPDVDDTLRALLLVPNASIVGRYELTDRRTKLGMAELN